MNLNFKHRNLDLARSRSTIINEECLGKYDAVTFDPKTEEAGGCKAESWRDANVVLPRVA